MSRNVSVFLFGGSVKTSRVVLMSFSVVGFAGCETVCVGGKLGGTEPRCQPECAAQTLDWPCGYVTAEEGTWARWRGVSPLSVEFEVTYSAFGALGSLSDVVAVGASVDAAFTSWNSVLSDLLMLPVSNTTAVTSGDGVNVVTLVVGAGESDSGGSPIAETICTSVVGEADAAPTGEDACPDESDFSCALVDCDIVIYSSTTFGGDVAFSDSTSPGSGEYSIATVVQHELGHAWGSDDQIPDFGEDYEDVSIMGGNALPGYPSQYPNPGDGLIGPKYFDCRAMWYLYGRRGGSDSSTPYPASYCGDPDIAY